MIESRMYPHTEERKSSKDSIKAFGEDVVERVASPPGPVGIAVPLCGSLPFAVIYQLLGLPEALGPTLASFGIGCSRLSAVREMNTHSSDTLGVSFWLAMQEVTHLHSGFIPSLPCHVSPLEHFCK